MSDPFSERRMTPRLSVEGRVTGAHLPANQAITVVDISRAGLAMRVGHEVAEGTTLRLRLWSGQSKPITLPAVVVYAMPVDDPQNGPHYLAGVVFINDDPFVMDEIARLITAVAGGTIEGAVSVQAAAEVENID